ncbi:predicted protein [Sclerotinia sclerotiorum 1980 UF-70]|uniref:Uncharacterized protein n=1 Tax=Sclerotinia sclerotiorum (strain ATCC 18683 / 1980 / Ss-1) TaxID=665079 RepID=A7EDV8_SCLS1|nr:predicted protein [Sclerotinia sclerotiorum 1980 UF-70]EDO01024.1 predicted protein [Sclerotinia sclerotiorum 1980 UF-70]
MAQYLAAIVKRKKVPVTINLAVGIGWVPRLVYRYVAPHQNSQHHPFLVVASGLMGERVSNI